MWNSLPCVLAHWQGHHSFYVSEIEERLKEGYRRSIMPWRESSTFGLQFEKKVENMALLLVLGVKASLQLPRWLAAVSPHHYEEMWGAFGSQDIISLSGTQKKTQNTRVCSLPLHTVCEQLPFSAQSIGADGAQN